MIIMSEASYHASYDHCTTAWLTQAGVPNTFIRLADVGINGNGHMMMVEKNADAIAAVIEKWLATADADEIAHKQTGPRPEERDRRSRVSKDGPDERSLSLAILRDARDLSHAGLHDEARIYSAAWRHWVTCAFGLALSLSSVSSSRSRTLLRNS